MRKENDKVIVDIKIKIKCKICGYEEELVGFEFSAEEECSWGHCHYKPVLEVYCSKCHKLIEIDVGY